MIKKFVFFTSLFANILCGFENCDDLVEFRTSAYLPVSHRFQSIYGHVRPSWELELTKTMGSWNPWVHFDWISCKGKSTGYSHSKTRVEMASLSFGLKFFNPLPCSITYYAGLGAVFTQIFVKNHFASSAHAFSPGIVLKNGLNIPLNDRIFADLFGDFNYQPDVFKTNVDLGGFRFGIGIGTFF